MSLTVTARHLAFAENVAAGMTGRDAARKAGFKGKDHSLDTLAWRLLKDKEVMKLVAAATEKASAARILTAQRRREILAEIAEGKVEQEIVTTGETATGHIHTTQKRKPTAAERKAAIEHLDKLDGLLIDKHEVTGKGGRPLHTELSEIETNKIRARLAELAGKKGKKA